MIKICLYSLLFIGLVSKINCSESREVSPVCTQEKDKSVNFSSSRKRSRSSGSIVRSGSLSPERCVSVTEPSQSGFSNSGSDLTEISNSQEPVHYSDRGNEFRQKYWPIVVPTLRTYEPQIFRFCVTDKFDMTTQNGALIKNSLIGGISTIKSSYITLIDSVLASLYTKANKVILEGSVIEGDVHFQGNPGVIELSENSELCGNIVNGTLKRKDRARSDFGPIIFSTNSGTMAIIHQISPNLSSPYHKAWHEMAGSAKNELRQSNDTAPLAYPRYPYSSVHTSGDYSVGGDSVVFLNSFVGGAVTIVGTESVILRNVTVQGKLLITTPACRLDRCIIKGPIILKHCGRMDVVDSTLGDGLVCEHIQTNIFLQNDVKITGEITNAKLATEQPNKEA